MYYPAQLSIARKVPKPHGGEMLFESLRLRNILSFRDTKINLGPLNVLIGSNATGKSNLIEAIALLKAAPEDLAGFLRRNGPVADWIWKGETVSWDASNAAELVSVLFNPAGTREAEKKLTYDLQITVNNDRLQVVSEKLENIRPYEYHQTHPFYYFSMDNGYGRISPARSRTDSAEDHLSESTNGPTTRLTPDNFAPTRSVMSQIRDPINFPVMTRTAHRLSSIRIYRDVDIRRHSPARRPQATDGDIEFLDDDLGNLALVANDLYQNRAIASLIDSNLERFYQVYDGLRFRVFGGTIQLAANETGMASAIPATRLSDGTMRFIALLTILCHPHPPELVCIEEPELAMHADVIPLLAELLRTMSERAQVVITTHSPELIDQFTSEPEAVVVCERGFDGDTQLRRLSQKELANWLSDYRLGELWKKGVLGGNRW